MNESDIATDRIFILARTCGFGVYPSGVIAALSSQGPSTAIRISALTGIPRSKAYQVIGELIKDGLVTSAKRLRSRENRRRTVAVFSLAPASSWMAWRDRIALLSAQAHSGLVEGILTGYAVRFKRGMADMNKKARPE